MVGEGERGGEGISEMFPLAFSRLSLFVSLFPFFGLSGDLSLGIFSIRNFPFLTLPQGHREGGRGDNQRKPVSFLLQPCIGEETGMYLGRYIRKINLRLDSQGKE